MRPRSINRLLVLWLALAVPPTVAVALLWPAYDAPAAFAAYVSWPLLRVLNARAWRRHFRPKRPSVSTGNRRG